MLWETACHNLECNCGSGLILVGSGSYPQEKLDPVQKKKRKGSGSTCHEKIDLKAALNFSPQKNCRNTVARFKGNNNDRSHNDKYDFKE